MIDASDRTDLSMQSRLLTTVWQVNKFLKVNGFESENQI